MDKWSNVSWVNDGRLTPRQNVGFRYFPPIKLYSWWWSRTGSSCYSAWRSQCHFKSVLLMALSFLMYLMYFDIFGVYLSHWHIFTQWLYMVTAKLNVLLHWDFQSEILWHMKLTDYAKDRWGHLYWILMTNCHAVILDRSKYYHKCNFIWDTGYSSETHLKLKSGEISVVHNSFFSCSIVFSQMCKISNDCVNEKINYEPTRVHEIWV